MFVALFRKIMESTPSLHARGFEPQRVICPVDHRHIERTIDASAHS